MKKKLAGAVALIAVLFACKKDSKTPELNNVKISSISGIGAFVYEGDKLVSVGNEKLYYDAKGRLIGSSINQNDTVRSVGAQG